jgi:hypothetical protein
MGFGIEIQDEWGGTVEATGDPKNILDRLLPAPGDFTQPMLGSIDPYANTVFNSIQMKWFLAEWSEISAKVQTAEERELVSKIETMARRIQNEPHMYLKFIGD